MSFRGSRPEPQCRKRNQRGTWSAANSACRGRSSSGPSTCPASHVERAARHCPSACAEEPATRWQRAASTKASPCSRTEQSLPAVDTAVSAGSFTTLATALKAAGLVDTLKGPGPFTVFAPTDAAFAKLPPDQLRALLADKPKLTAVLTYHVVPGLVMSKDVKAGTVKTVQGSNLNVTTMGGVKVNSANVTTVDIVADNGVIHVIDTVVLPN